MAKAGRTESVAVAPDGAVTLKITTGTAPLPAAWQGEALNFASKAEFLSAIEAVETKVTAEDLAMIQAAKAFKADPAMGAAFITQCAGKTCTLDLTGAVAPITVG